MEASQTTGGKPRRPRVAITGSAGVGKTTLGRRLAEAWNVAFVPEGIRARLEAGLDLHALSRTQHAALIEELRREAQAAKAAALETAGGFVADRCSLDFAAFWLYFGFADDLEATERMMERCRAAASAYDLVVVLPWGVLALEEDGIRSTNPWRQLHYQVLLEGLIRRWIGKDRVAFLPDHMAELDARLAWVRSLAEDRVGA